MWQPILEGELRERALAALADLAREVPCALLEDETKLSLASGASGRVLFHAYLARASGSVDDFVAARRFLRQVLDTWPASTAPWRAQLYEDLLGLAWVAVHLDEPFVEDQAETTDWDEMDELLPTLAELHGRLRNHELLCGQVGLGLYALERLPLPRAQEGLARIIDELSRAATRDGRGVTWIRTAPEGSWQRKAWRGEYADVGVAHGVASILPLLGEAIAADVAAGSARALLEPAVAWLLDQRIPGAEDTAFPALVAPGLREAPRRLAWCYGDVGVAGALLHAARCSGREDWEGEALGIARKVMRLGPDRAQGVDASVCHGSGGLGHIFNRMYQASGDEGLREAAVRWFARALDFRRPGTGVGGYLAIGDVDGQAAWVSESGFLTGAAGVGLCLLAATSAVEPRWDRVLALSGPSGGASRRSDA